MKIECSTVLFAAGLLFSACVEADKRVYRIPSGQNVYFRSDHIVGKSYLCLRRDGTYQRIAREHMFVKESDRGKWSQADGGELTLVSEQHYRNVEAPPLSIFMWYPEAAQRLPFLKMSLERLLFEKRSDFRASEIEEIEKYGYENCLSRISVDFPVEKVTRRQLKALLTQIDLFLGDDQKNHFHAVPMQYESATFLVWRDAEIPPNRNLENIKKQINSIEKDGDNPVFIYCEIDRETFEREAKTTQDFIFYPEMNEAAATVKEVSHP